jgi:hypothetical protein
LFQIEPRFRKENRVKKKRRSMILSVRLHPRTAAGLLAVMQKKGYFIESWSQLIHIAAETIVANAEREGSVTVPETTKDALDYIKSQGFSVPERGERASAYDMAEESQEEEPHSDRERLAKEALERMERNAKK